MPHSRARHGPSLRYSVEYGIVFYPYLLAIGMRWHIRHRSKKRILISKKEDLQQLGFPRGHPP